jgi:hypothetical protein
VYDGDQERGATVDESTITKKVARETLGTLHNCQLLHSPTLNAEA